MRRRIAVVGSGIAGLTAAYTLNRAADVTLYEAGDRFGGHAHTHDVVSGGRPYVVDSGFIVHNRRTYPHLTRLFDELGVATRETGMSMSVSCAGCGLEYAGGRGAGGLFPSARAVRPAYLRMLAEVPRFHRAARRQSARTEGDGPTLEAFLAEGGYSRYFVRHFAVPLVSAVWSCPPGLALRYPARYLFAFLDNHGMLSVHGSPTWRTVVGGSRTYVERVVKNLAAARTDAPVRAVRRVPGGVEVRDGADGTRAFDGVVVATHPGDALRLLAAPTRAEREVLGAFRYTRSRVLLHTDGRMLPRAPRARASWNHALPSCDPAAGEARVSYDMNRLQRLGAPDDLIVTLNDPGTVPDDRVLARMEYEHPLYTPETLAAQRRLPELDDGVVAYAGAYHGWGFHEDGCRSGIAAARTLGAR
ncbi:MAG TPA: FAD-dependent oxidoreductase [Streptosporangiaceae bacterium]|jgi:predicted NAD/FAD-binding protein